MNDSTNEKAARAGVGRSHRGDRLGQAPVRLGRCALAAAVVASTLGSAPARATSTPDVASAAENRLWGGCQLTSNTASALVTETGGPADFIVVYSLQKNDGQPFQNNVRFTGPIVCTGPTTKIRSYTEGTPLPNADTGGSSIDILSTEQAQVVRYTGTGTEKRICRTVGNDTACYRVRAQVTASGCRLTTTTYNAIVTAIAKGNTGIIDAGVNFAFVMAHSVQGFAGSRICAAPGFVATTDSLPTGIDILDTEEALLVRYRINGGGRNGKVEKRLCHTVANKTDCFRLFQ